MYPGINTYYVHYAELFNSSKILLYVLSQRWKEQVEKDAGKIILDNFDNGFKSVDKKLIPPFILTMYSFLECLLSELEDSIDKSKFELSYSRKKRPEITERIGILHELLTSKQIDKSTTVYADYKYAIKIRNLITHASGEQITWSRVDIAPTGVQVSANEYHYNKEDFIKCGFEGNIFRNKEADKIIRYLAGKKLVPEFWQGRYQGWLNYISLPPVANWLFHSIINMITPTLLELAKSDDNSIEQFAKGAQRTIFDKEISQNDYDEMLNKN
jgi:hypothetical protein